MGRRRGARKRRPWGTDQPRRDLGDAEPPLSRGDGEGFAHHEQNTMGTVGGPTVLAALAGGPHRVTERGGDVGGLDLDERQMGCGVAASPASRDSRRPGGCKHIARRERERPLHTLGGPQRGAQEVFPPPDTKKSPPAPFPPRLVEQTQRFEIQRGIGERWEVTGERWEVKSYYYI